MKNEILCRFDEDGSLELYEPYAMVECETKEDYDSLVELTELGKSVVRCKDCKQWGGVTFGNVCRRWSAPLAGMKNCTKPDDFCSYGERRDNDA